MQGWDSGRSDDDRLKEALLPWFPPPIPGDNDNSLPPAPGPLPQELTRLRGLLQLTATEIAEAMETEVGHLERLERSPGIAGAEVWHYLVAVNHCLDRRDSLASGRPD